MIIAKQTPSDPPPGYSAVPPLQLPGQGDPETDPMGSNPPPQRQAYGPTPLVQQSETLLPYYDPRSPYSMQQSVTRARWRFVKAFMWAVGIWMAIGFITGGIIIDVRLRN